MYSKKYRQVYFFFYINIKIRNQGGNFSFDSTLFMAIEVLRLEYDSLHSLTHQSPYCFLQRSKPTVIRTSLAAETSDVF